MRDEILELRRRLGAVIIAHYYQEPDIQDLSDYVGDSLGMALFARRSGAKVAVVCGVRFMAETIKAMNMDKTVLLPDTEAGCSLADSCTPAVFSYFRGRHPGAFVMTYVNSSLEIKAMSDVIVTSANAVTVAKKVPPDQPILFAPDRHLGRYVSRAAGRDMALFPGNCFVHTSFSAQEMFRIKAKNPDALIIAHPECEEAVLNRADYIGSTGSLLEFVKTSPARRFIVMTEPGIIHQMKKAVPDKEFIAGPDLAGCACNVCPHMKLNTLEKLRDCLRKGAPRIEIACELAARALVPLDRMVEMTGAGPGPGSAIHP